MKPSELKEGKVYFMCMYAHPNLPIPEITPYVYLGFDGEGYKFQNPDKFIGSKALSKLSGEGKSEIEVYFSGDDMYVTDQSDIEAMFEDINGLKSFIEKLKDSEFYGQFY